MPSTHDFRSKNRAVGAIGPVLVCLDSFKGSLSAAEASEALAGGISASLPGAQVLVRPMADGGEGTVEALVRAGWGCARAEVAGPAGERLTARFAVRDDAAVIELAEAAGLGRLGSGLDPLGAHTFGVGELIRAALDRGCRTITLAVGGSASTDGGAGMLVALGVQLRSSDGRAIPLGGGGLAELASVDISSIDPLVAATTFLLASDVDNPLLGSSGAAAVFAPQKGAGARQIALLETGLSRYAALVSDAVDKPGAADLAGAGAAGGTGFAALAVLDARRISGAELVLDQTGLCDELATAGVVVVGEGRLDDQTMHGKAPLAVARAAAEVGAAVYAVAGEQRLSRRDLTDAGIQQAWSLTDLAGDRLVAMRDARRLLGEIGLLLGAELAGAD